MSKESFIDYLRHEMAKHPTLFEDGMIHINDVENYYEDWEDED